MNDLAATIEWILVPGGICHFGDLGKPRAVADLLVAATPLAWPDQQDRDEQRLPVTGISQAEAARLAAEVGARLPTSVEWEWTAAGPDRRPYPWGDHAWTPQHAVLTADDRTPSGPRPVGTHPAGATPEGLLDLAGNVWEWTASPVMGGGYVIRGGSYACKPLYARTTFLNAAPAERRSPGISVRPVRTA